MKKLLTLLLTTIFVTQTAFCTNNAPSVTETIGGALRSAGTNITNAGAWVSDKSTQVAANTSYVYNEFGVPAAKNIYGATSETLSATKDLTILAKDTGYGMGKFVNNHWKFSLVVSAAVAIYILNRSATGVVEAQYLKLQKFIDNTLAEVSQFDVSADNISTQKGIILAACDIYYPTTSPLFLGAGAWYYRDEVGAIDNFFKQVSILKRYLADHHSGHDLIQSQMREIREAASVVQFLLAKRLNLFSAQRILSRR
jgi:hypothetical protein